MNCNSLHFFCALHLSLIIEILIRTTAMQVVRGIQFIKQGRKERSEETINKITNMENDAGG